MARSFLGAVSGSARAAERFAVSASSAIRWRARERIQGDARPKPLGGDRRSRRIEAHAALILSLVEDAPDIALVEIKTALAANGVAVGVGTLWRFFERRRITFKRKRAAAEQDRPDVNAARTAWFEGQLDLAPPRRQGVACAPPARIVFIDGTWAATNMARR